VSLMPCSVTCPPSCVQPDSLAQAAAKTGMTRATYLRSTVRRDRTTVQRPRARLKPRFKDVRRMEIAIISSFSAAS
jgi:hypothetical protein